MHLCIDEFDGMYKHVLQRLVLTCYDPHRMFYLPNVDAKLYLNHLKDVHYSH